MKKICFLLLCSTLLSCAPVNKVLLRSMGIFNNTVQPVLVRSSTKELVCLPMHHIGTPAFYAHTRHLVDSLHARGFMVLYETVQFAEHTSIASRDSLARKFRKVVGQLNRSGFIDSAGDAINGRKYPFLRQLINQPANTALGLHPQQDVLADATVNELVNDFEQRFGTISLTACDWATPLGEPYHCKKAYSRYQRQYFVSAYRNHLLAALIQTNTCRRIALVYGENHVAPVIKLLQAADSSWRRIKQ